jgi:hypothetical protein
MTRFPTWLKIAIPVVLLLGLALAALFKVLLEKPPEYAQLPAIEARFGEQLDILLELARTNPYDGCMEHDAPQDVLGQVELLKPWWEQVEVIRDRFADPAILDAEVVYYCDDFGFGTNSFGIKDYQEPIGSWSRSLFLPADEFPSVNLWHAGPRRYVRYEDRLSASDGIPRGIRLVLDLERLAGPSTQDLPVDAP